MNTKNENENPGEARKAQATPTVREPAEEEEAASSEAADSREVAEGGYGWGV